LATRQSRWKRIRPYLLGLRVAVLCAALVGAACHGRHEKVFIEDDAPETGAQPVSVFKMNDPAASRQLVGGFYSLEGQTWRWTKQDFVISFKTPPEAARRGAVASFDFVIPDVEIQKLSTVQLAAAVSGKQVGVTRYTSPGSYTFKAEVPGELCGHPQTVVDFHLEKALPPASGDGRELGVIATAAALQTR
jgi:hypothetical protein